MRILIVAPPGGRRALGHAEVLLAAGGEVHVAYAAPSGRPPAFDARATFHLPSAEIRPALSLLARRARLGAARLAFRGSDVARLITGTHGAPGPLAIRPPGGPFLAAAAGIDLPSLGEVVGSGAFVRAPWLAHLIDELRPDVVLSLGIRVASYLTLMATAYCRRAFPPWIVGEVGHIHLLGQTELHRPQIEAVLVSCDFFAAESRRDVELARLFGYAGAVLGVTSLGGGYDLEQVRRLRGPGRPSTRRTILVKGEQDLGERPMVALRAVALCADALRGYRVAIFAAGPDVKLAAQVLDHDSGVPIEILPPLEHVDFLRTLGQARVCLGLSWAGGLNSSALEAMVLGAFPIQSCTSALDEWVRDGASGSLVHPDDPVGAAAALRRALEDDDLVDSAAEENARTVDERLAAQIVAADILEMYERLVKADTDADAKGNRLPIRRTGPAPRALPTEPRADRSPVGA